MTHLNGDILVFLSPLLLLQYIALEKVDHFSYSFQKYQKNALQLLALCGSSLQ